MKFTTLEREAFQTFLDKNPLRTFFQTVEMEEIGKLGGWKSDYVGILQNGNIVAAARLMSKKTHFGKKIFYAPRGLLVDYQNQELLTFFIKELKQFIKKQGGYTLHIDPPVIYKERDINGDLVENGIDNSHIVDVLKSLGFHHDGFIRHYDPTKQVRWSFELPTKEKTKEEILKQMQGNTRRAIQKAEHLKVKVRELKREELPIFKEIMEHTSERREFVDKTLDYYETMYDVFKPKEEIQYMIAEVSLEEAKEVLQKDLEKLEATLAKAQRQKKEALQKETESQITTLNIRISEVEKLQQEKGNHLYLACGMFMLYGKEVLYYHAGSYKEYMNFFGQYLIQWEMIQKAIDLNKECYNFYGIKGVFDKKDPDYGVYLFKKGFNGHVVEYIGDFYLPVSPYYYLLHLKSKMRKKG